MSARLAVSCLLVNILLGVHSEKFCEKYAIRCGLRHRIVCRERVGGVVGTSLYSSITLTCPYLYEARTVSWSFSNSTGSSVSFPQQNTHGLSLHSIDKSQEGAYTCTVTLPDNRVYTETTQIFLHVSGHAYFQSCPETTNGRNCTKTQHLQTVVNRNVMFDTRVGYRDGGACGTKQDIRYLSLMKGGENMYFCFDIPTKSNCSNNGRFNVTNQGKDKFDFHLTMKDVALSDAGEYILELNIGDAEGYQSISIYMKYNLRVSELLPTVPPESNTLDPHCSDSNHQVKGAVLIFRGDVLSNNTNITVEYLGNNETALLCIVPELSSEVEAKFLWPNGTSIENSASNQLYITRGKQIIRLNSMTPSAVQSGNYCCIVSSRVKNPAPQCVHLYNRRDYLE